MVVKSSLGYSSVFVFLAARFTLAALLMATFRPHVFRSLKKEELLAGAALSFFMFGGYASQTAGLQYTTPAKAAFVTGSSVVMVPLLLAIFWGRRLTPWVYAGVFAAFFGVSHLNHGDLLTFIAAGLYAVHVILVGDYTRRHSVAALSVLQVAACAALAWLAIGLTAVTGWQPQRFSWQWQSLLGIAICAVLATALAFSIQLWAQQFTSSSHAAILFTLEPVFASITSYLLIRERLGSRALLGAAFVLAAILIAEILGPPAAPESPEPTAEAVETPGYHRGLCWGTVHRALAMPMPQGHGTCSCRLISASASVRVVLHVHGFVHRSGRSVGLLVSGNLRFVL